MKLKAGQIGKTLKLLTDAGYTLSDLEHFGRWWNEKDFRGRSGQPPTMTQVLDTILQSKQSQPEAKAEVAYETVIVDGEIKFREVTA